MSNLWPLIVLPLVVACGDKEDDTATEDTAEETAEDTAEETTEE